METLRPTAGEEMRKSHPQLPSPPSVTDCSAAHELSGALTDPDFAIFPFPFRCRRLLPLTAGRPGDASLGGIPGHLKKSSAGRLPWGRAGSDRSKQ